jgi:DNA-binding NarL/FixJ family response regulator
VIRVLLVEDHAALRQALAIALSMQNDIEVVGQTGTLAEARGRLNGVDVVVLDIDLEDGNGLDLIPDISRISPQTQVLVLTASGSRLEVARAIMQGAGGVLHKSVGLEEIVDAVRRVAAGETLFSAEDVVELVRLAGETRQRQHDAEMAIARLTARERDVLTALAQGLSDRQIADRLHVSHETVRTHMVNVLGKLGVSSRLQALVFAVRHGVVRID